MTTIYCGIDPGASGGIAFLYGTGAVRVEKAPATVRDLVEVLREELLTDLFVIVEKVGPARGLDGRKQGVSSAFSFGRNVGTIEGVLAGLDVAHDFVAPRTWQREFSLLRTDKAETITDKKNRHKAAAQRLFPAVKVTHTVADALLLAEWGRRLRSRV